MIFSANIVTIFNGKVLSSQRLQSLIVHTSVKDGVDLSSGFAGRAMIGCSHGVDYTNVDPNKPGDRRSSGPR